MIIAVVGGDQHTLASQYGQWERGERCRINCSGGWTTEDDNGRRRGGEGIIIANSSRDYFRRGGGYCVFFPIIAVIDIG